MMFHPPRFPWNKGNSLSKPPFGVKTRVRSRWNLTRMMLLLPFSSCMLQWRTGKVTCVSRSGCNCLILLMEEILHQLIGSLSHYLQGFINARWCRISSINSMKHVLIDWRKRGWKSETFKIYVSSFFCYQCLPVVLVSLYQLQWGGKNRRLPRSPKDFRKMESM